MKEDFKVRVFQPIIQEYRLALYEGLAAKYGDSIEVWASPNRGDEVSLPIKGMRYDYNHSWHQFGPFIWQAGFSLHGLRRGDVIVICGDVHHLSSLLLAVKAKIRGIKVIWWGHHVSALAKPLNVRIRLMVCRALSDVVLCYTDAGIDFMKARGFKRVYATGNTIDLVEVECEAIKFKDKQLLEPSPLTSTFNLLFCGVLREKTRVDILLHALAILKSRRPFSNSNLQFRLVIIGNGEKFAQWQQLAEVIGVSDMVEWTGELRGQTKLAPYFCRADLFVYPGRIGLSLMHAFAYRLPVVLNDNPADHGPEYVAFKPGENGWAFKYNDAEDMADKIAEASVSCELKQRGERGYRFVSENYSMSRMVERYVEAIEG